MIARELLAAVDFTMLRAELVRTLGGDATAALVLTRIHWRAEREAEGEWWRGSAGEIADETGLSEDQVNRSVKKLRLAGHLETTEAHREGAWDRTLSYRLVWSESSHTAQSRDDTAKSRPVPPAKSRAVPSPSKTYKNKELHTEDREARIEAWLRSVADATWQHEDHDIPDAFARPQTELWKGWLTGPTPAARRTVDFSRSWRNWVLRAWLDLTEFRRDEWRTVEQAEAQ